MFRGDSASVVVVGYLRKREVGSPFDEDLEDTRELLDAFRYLTFRVLRAADQ